MCSLNRDNAEKDWLVITDSFEFLRDWAVHWRNDDSFIVLDGKI